MHDGFSLDTEFMSELAIGTVVAILAWFINTVKSMATDKIGDLDRKHKDNSSRIDKQGEKIQEMKTDLEILKTTSIKREDLDKVFNGLREELKEDIDCLFTRVHERMDNLYMAGRSNDAPHNSQVERRLVARDES
jgi:hypothetical protein